MEQLPVSYYHTAREGEGGTRANFCWVLCFRPVRATHPITITVYFVANSDPILNAFGQMKQLYNCESSQFFKSLFLPKFYNLQNLDYVRPHSSNCSVNTTHL